MKELRADIVVIDEDSVSISMPEDAGSRGRRFDIFDPEKQAIRDADQAFQKFVKELAPADLLK